MKQVIYLSPSFHELFFIPKWTLLVRCRQRRAIAETAAESQHRAIAETAAESYQIRIHIVYHYPYVSYRISYHVSYCKIH